MDCFIAPYHAQHYMFSIASQVPYSSYILKANRGHSNRCLLLNPHLNKLMGGSSIFTDHERSNPGHLTHLVCVSLKSAQWWVH